VQKSFLLVLLLGSVLLLAAYAVAKEGRGRHGHRGEGNHAGGSRSMRLVGAISTDQYAANCGGCHYAFPPQLMPERSWRAIMGSLNNHFGQELTLSEQDKTAIGAFLTENAADKSACGISQRIMSSLDGATPSRITDIPCIQRKHRKIDPAVFKRKSIQSPANCAACHTTAASGNFAEDHARIPSE
jgi:hypothetical protein